MLRIEPRSCHRMCSAVFILWHPTIVLEVIPLTASFEGLPRCIVNLLLLVDVDPELLLGIIAYTLVLLMKTIKCTTNNVILRLSRSAI